MSTIPTTPGPVLTTAALFQVLDDAASLIYIKDPDGRFLFVNRPFLDLFGLRFEEVIGRKDADLFPAASAEEFRRNDLAVFRSGRPIETEETLHHRGEARIYRSRKFPLLDDGGRPYALCGVSQDVTEEKRFEAALESIALGVSAAVGDEVFDAIVARLAAALGVDFAFIAAFEPAWNRSQLTTLAALKSGRPIGPLCYAVEYTPCQVVLHDGFQFFDGDAIERFSPDPMLREMGFVSYAGVPLMNSAGERMGVLSICHTGRLPDRGIVGSMLRIFSVRAAAELERRRADDARRVSEASYRTIFEASEDPIFVHDIRSGRIVDVNPKACEVYGYEREELLKLGPGDLSSGVPPYTADDAIRHVRRAMEGEVVKVEWHRRNKDGSLHWDEVYLRKATIAGTARILATTREITERKEREEALRRSEDRLRATVQAALDCIVVMDSGGRVTEFNPAAEAAFGHRREDVIGRRLADLLIPERFRRAHSDGLERYLKTGTGPFLGSRRELSALHADGREVPVELAISKASGPDGPLFIGYMRDITDRQRAEEERRRLESQLLQAQKMEAIGHLAGGIAHDFNNLLTGIMGYLALAGERAQAGGDETMTRYLERARHSGQRAADLVQQMLTFSRGQRGEPRPLRPAMAVEECVNLVRGSVPSSVQFDLEITADDAWILADPVQLEQVLMNLCINARDAMDGSGSVGIGLHRHQAAGLVCSSCGQAVDGNYVELSVTDTGPGVPPEVMERMFEPFFSTKEVGRGSGMGLSTVHGIVHEQGGHVVVENRPAGGACFRVLLRPTDEAGRGDASAAEPSAATSVRRLRGRVLVVDDEDSVREFLADLLAGRGLDVVACADPLEAEGLVAATPGGVDAAILDFSMARLNGVELARRLHQAHPRLPIVICSGYAENLSGQAVREAGARALLAKPLDLDRLLALLAELLGP